MKSKKVKRKYTRKIDRRMKDYGECNYETKTIRVNPRKRDLLNTIIHEELHRQHIDWSEGKVKKESVKREQSLTIAQAAQLLKKYQRNTRDE